ERLEVKLRDGSGRGLGEKRGREKQREHASEDRPERDELPRAAGPTRRGLREKDRPFLSLRPRGAHADEQRKERDEIDRDLHKEKCGRAFRFGYAHRRDAVRAAER